VCAHSEAEPFVAYGFAFETSKPNILFDQGRRAFHNTFGPCDDGRIAADLAMDEVGSVDMILQVSHDVTTTSWRAPLAYYG
jgi:hypothetical protein